MDFKVERSCNCEQNSDRCQLCDWGVGVEIIDPIDLRKTPCNKSGFEARNPAKLVFLVFEYPFAGDDLSICRPGNQSPGIIPHNRIVFVHNGFLPLLRSSRMRCSLPICRGFLLIIRIRGSCKLCNCFTEPWGVLAFARSFRYT